MSDQTTTFSEALFFLKKSIKAPFLNASLVPSSKAAAYAMLKDVDFSKIKTVVELGPGTGPYTAEIVKRASPDCKIILIEIDSDYVTLLQKKFAGRVIVEHGGAENLEAVLKQHDVVCPDLIVSALPFLPATQRKILFAALRRYTEKGAIFRFEMILQPWGVRVYKSLPIEKKAFIWMNFPPMWIYGIN